MSPTDILEADSASDFSDYRTSAAVSSTQSLTSSIQEHVYANGRRYHRKSEGRYALPSDEIEQDRLDMQHREYIIEEASMTPS